MLFNLPVCHIDARTPLLTFIPVRPFPFIPLCIPAVVSSVSKFIQDFIRTLSDAISIHSPRSNIELIPWEKSIERNVKMLENFDRDSKNLFNTDILHLHSHIKYFMRFNKIIHLIFTLDIIFKSHALLLHSFSKYFIQFFIGLLKIEIERVR